MKKIYISTLGCAKNLVDSEMMVGSLLSSGYQNSNDLDQADIAIVNTCGFIESAKEESIAEILEIAKKKQDGKLKQLVVTGCLAQRYSKELEEEIPEIDLILGTTSFNHIVEKIEALEEGKRDMLIESIDKSIEELPRHLLTESYSAYLKIAEGCDNLCTYCIIPKLRGKYRSRNMEDIVSEAKSLAENGVKEIIIIAQDTTKYGKDNYNKKMLPQLLQQIDEIKGIEWIRVLYSYPEDIDLELVQVIKNSQKILPYFDMPIQHGSNRILKLMNRHTTKEQIREKVQMIRREIPSGVIRTTLIVGFPMENEEDFQELAEFVEEMEFDRLGVFEYSLEENTPAAKMTGQLAPEIKFQRRAKIMEIQQEISRKKNKEYVGQQMRVLIDGKSEDGIYEGRTYRDMMEIDGIVFVHSDRNLKKGDMIHVSITDSLDYDLIGEYYEHTK